MTLYLLKVYLQTFLSVPVTQKCQILSCDTLVASERYVYRHRVVCIACGWLGNVIIIAMKDKIMGRNKVSGKLSSPVQLVYRYYTYLLTYSMVQSSS